MAIGENREQALHPLRIVLKRLGIREWFRLGGECRVGRTLYAATVPAFAAFAGLEKFQRGILD